MSAMHMPKNMIAYYALYNALEGEFDGCELRHVGRESNEEADRLANIGSTCARVPPGVFLEQICVPSIKWKFPKGSPEEAEHSGATLPEGHEGPKKLDTEVAMVNLMQVKAAEETWTRPYLQYLIDGDFLTARRMPGAYLAGQKPSPSSMASCTSATF